MKVSFRHVIMLAAIVAVCAAVISYPTQGYCGRYDRGLHLKIVEPVIDPNIKIGDPGDDPHNSFSGSSTTGSIEELNTLKPVPDAELIISAKDVLFHLIFLQLIKSGPVTGF